MNKSSYLQDSGFCKEGCKEGSKESFREKKISECSTIEILSELGSRFNISYGELKAKYHNRQPSTKIVIDHKVEKEIE